MDTQFLDLSNSSVLILGAYTPVTPQCGELMLLFKRNGNEAAAYLYRIPHCVLEGLILAESKGKFFSHQIRPFFDGVKVKQIYGVGGAV